MKKYFDLSEIKNRALYFKNLNPKKKILAVDFGTRKIGLACFSFESRIISPLPIFFRSKSDRDKDLEYFFELIKAHDIHSIIIGASLIRDFRGGKENIEFGNKKLFLESLKFFEDLSKNLQDFERPFFAFFDESFSSVFANQTLYEYNFSQKQIRKNEDSVAALKILSDALEEMELL